MPTARAPVEPSLAAQLAEQGLHARVRRAITERFEFTGQAVHKVRCTVVHDLVAKILGAPHWLRVTRISREYMRELGAWYVTPFNKRFFAGVKPKEQELVPGEGRSLFALQTAWAKRMREEGMGEEPGEQPRFQAYRAELNLAMLARMRRDYWDRMREMKVWGLYAMEGLSEQQIADQLDIHKSSVHRIVAREKARMNRPIRLQGRGMHGDAQADDAGSPRRRAAADRRRAGPAEG